jgi:glycosyltransferase 2 family protein
MKEVPSNLKTLLRWLPGIVISAIAIIAIIKFVNIIELKLALSSISWKLIVIVFFVDTLSLVVRGKAWQTILGGKVSLKDAFFGVSEGYFVNNVLPFRAGEVGRSYFLGRRSGLGTFYVLSTIVIERAFDLFFASSIVIVALPFLVGLDWLRPIAIIALLLVLSGVAILFLIARIKEKVLGWLNRFSNQSRLAMFLVPKFRSLIEGSSSVSKPSQFGLSLFWIGLGWVIWSVLYYLPVGAIMPGSPLWWGAFVSSVLSLGVAIPSAPSAIGVYEAAFVGAIVIVGGASSKALAYAIVLHFMQFLVSGIFGIWGLIREGMSFSQLINSINRTGVDQKTKEAG